LQVGRGAAHVVGQLLTFIVVLSLVGTEKDSQRS